MKNFKKTRKTNKTEILERTLSQVASVPVQITIRSAAQFTFSFDGENKAAEEAIKSYFNNQLVWEGESGYHSDIDLTCLFAVLPGAKL